MINAKYTLKVTGSNKKIMWKSSNPKVAKVSKSGEITAISKGEATITATIGAGSKNTKLTCTVTVKSRLSTNLKGKPLYTPLDEYQEILITFTKPKDDEYLTALTSNNNIDIEFGDTKGDVTSLYITPQKKGITTITIGIEKDEYTNNESSNYTNDENIAYYEDINKASAERDYINKISSSSTTYDPIEVKVYVGIDENGWINKSELESIFDVYTLIYDDFIQFLPNDSSSSTGNTNSFSIKVSEKTLNKVYTYEGLRYRFIKSNTVQFNIGDLKKLGIIEF